MCGIVGYVGRHAATPVLLGGLRRLEYRGYDSAGLSVQDGNELLTLRAVGKVSRLADKVRAEWPDELQTRCVVGIAHTRWATHGAPTEANAHPHADASGRIRLVHNGIIENYRAIRSKLEAKGHVFASVNITKETSARPSSRPFDRSREPTASPSSRPTNPDASSSRGKAAHSSSVSAKESA